MNLHSLLTSKKLNKLKNKLSFLICQESTVTGQTATTKTGESDKQIQKIIQKITNGRNRIHEQTLPNYWCLGRKTELYLTNCWRLRVNNCKLKTPPVAPSNRAGVGNTFVNFTFRNLYHVLTVNREEKSWCSQQEEGKEEEPFETASTLCPS